MGCHNRRMLYHIPRGVRSGSVRPNRTPNRTMAYRDHLMTPLWDHQHRHSCRHREYQSLRHDPRAGPPLPSADGGREPPQLGRRRRQPVAESVRPDPGACRPPFRPSSVCCSAYLALSPTRPTASNPGLPARPSPHVTDLRHDHVRCARILMTKIRGMWRVRAVARARRGGTRRAPRREPGA